MIKPKDIAHHKPGKFKDRIKVTLYVARELRERFIKERPEESMSKVVEILIAKHLDVK